MVVGDFWSWVRKELLLEASGRSRRGAIVQTHCQLAKSAAWVFPNNSNRALDIGRIKCFTSWKVSNQKWCFMGFTLVSATYWFRLHLSVVYGEVFPEIYSLSSYFWGKLKKKTRFDLFKSSVPIESWAAPTQPINELKTWFPYRVGSPPHFPQLNRLCGVVDSISQPSIALLRRVHVLEILQGGPRIHLQMELVHPYKWPETMVNFTPTYRSYGVPTPVSHHQDFSQF